MAKISGLKNKLKKGDIRDIAKATGFSTRYVEMVLSESDKRSNEKIIKAAKIIINNRSSLSLKLKLCRD